MLAKENSIHHFVAKSRTFAGNLGSPILRSQETRKPVSSGLDQYPDSSEYPNHDDENDDSTPTRASNRANLSGVTGGSSNDANSPTRDGRTVQLNKLNQILEAARDQVEQQHGGLHHVNKHALYKLVLLLCIV